MGGLHWCGHFGKYRRIVIHYQRVHRDMEIGGEGDEFIHSHPGMVLAAGNVIGGEVGGLGQFLLAEVLPPT